jgi:hypothetical protein
MFVVFFFFFFLSNSCEIVIMHAKFIHLYLIHEDYFSSLIIKKGTMQNDPNEDARNAYKFPIY